MRGNTIYLEAPDRTQDLLNIKWALLSAGYSIGSTWHNGDAITWPAFKDHWNAFGMEQLQLCDCLVVICGTRGTVAPELAMMAGFALACGIRLYWIGPLVGGLRDFRAVEQFDSTEIFLKQLLSRKSRESVRNNERVAA